MTASRLQCCLHPKAHRSLVWAVRSRRGAVRAGVAGNREPRKDKTTRPDLLKTCRQQTPTFGGEVRFPAIQFFPRVEPDHFGYRQAPISNTSDVLLVSGTA